MDITWTTTWIFLLFDQNNWNQVNFCLVWSFLTIHVAAQLFFNEMRWILSKFLNFCSTILVFVLIFCWFVNQLLFCSTGNVKCVCIPFYVQCWVLLLYNLSFHFIFILYFLIESAKKQSHPSIYGSLKIQNHSQLNVFQQNSKLTTITWMFGQFLCMSREKQKRNHKNV